MKMYRQVSPIEGQHLDRCFEKVQKETGRDLVGVVSPIEGQHLDMCFEKVQRRP